MDALQRRSTSVTTSTVIVDLTSARSGDQLDFDALYRSARDDLFAYAATLLRDRAAAEDVTSLAFERAYRRRRGFQPERGSARAWLFGIARNAALDELRRRKRAATMETEPAADAPGPDDEAERALRRAALRVALQSLAPRDRELIALKFHAGLDNAELAVVLGVSVSNAGTLLHRAVQKLRKAIDEHA